MPTYVVTHCWDMGLGGGGQAIAREDGSETPRII